MDKNAVISIVEDDPSARSVLSRLFRSVGYDVSVHDSSESFLAADVLDKTDCLILDVQLPGKSGLELQADLIKARKICPIVFISSFQDDSIRTRAIENGAIDFLGKPLDIDRLLELVEAAISDSTA